MSKAPETEQSPESTTISGSQWNGLTQAEPFAERSIIPEPWTDFPDEYEELDESEPDIDGVPQTVWRGERLYLHNLDELNQRAISTKGHERRHNRDGQVYVARDKKYASLYAVGTDGVKFYNGPLPVEEIPIGVVYKINNSNNHLHAHPTHSEPDSIGPFAGKFREFTTTEVPPEDYSVSEIYVMDDFFADGAWLSEPSEPYPYKHRGHNRSDFRRPLEVYKLRDQADLPQVIDQVKRRMHQLDAERKIK